MSTVFPQPASNQANQPPADRPSPPTRVVGLGVIALLVAALVAIALSPTLLPASYSWVEHGVSESAAQGLDEAWLTRLGFIAFGLGVVWVVGLRHPDWGPLATLLHLVFGVSMFGVAAFSAKSWEDNAAFVQSEDVLHSVFAATAGFGFVVGVVTLIVVRRHRSTWAALPDWAAFVVTATIPFAASTSIWGALQRLMFLTAAAWYGREAWLATRRPGGV